MRGQKTRERILELGYPCPAIFGDPAVLLPLVIQPKVKKHSIGIIPHFVEYSAYADRFGTEAFVIDVCRSVENVVQDISSCDFTYSSSLHGLIVSHAYGVPSIWMASSQPLQGDDVKFDDYFSSCDISPLRRTSLLLQDKFRKDDAYATLPAHAVLQAALMSSLPQGWRL